MTQRFFGEEKRNSFPPLAVVIKPSFRAKGYASRHDRKVQNRPMDVGVQPQLQFQSSSYKKGRGRRKGYVKEEIGFSHNVRELLRKEGGVSNG